MDERLGACRGIVLAMFVAAVLWCLVGVAVYVAIAVPWVR